MRILRRPLLVLGAACTLVVSLSGQTVRVLSVSGEATLQAPGEAAPRAVVKGDTIVVGTRIVTGEGARVILTPLPGVNSIIAPKSDLVIERVSVTRDPGAKVALHAAVLDLKTGAVTTDLQKTEGVELDYGVRTARGLAGARGTTYTVGINAAGIQTVVVADGVISLTLADGRVVSLVPGQVSITKTDGTTQSVTKATELSTGDQAIADNWVETTLDALAEAIDQGVAIDSGALEDAIRAARELGVEVDAETQGRLDRARQQLEQRRQAADDTLKTTDGKTDAEVVTEKMDATGFDLAAFLATLTPEQRAAFLALPAPARDQLGAYFAALGTDVQRRAVLTYSIDLGPDRLSAFLALGIANRDSLVLANDPDFTAFALDPYGEGQVRSQADIAYVGKLSAVRRASFFASSGIVQNTLLNRPDDTGLAAFALTPDGEGGLRAESDVLYFSVLSGAQRTAFRAFSPEIQAGLVALNDAALTTYALVSGRDPAAVTFALTLDSTHLAAFLSRSGAIKNLLVANSADADLVAFALDPDPSSETNDLRPAPVVTFYAGLPSDRRLNYAALPSDLQATLASAQNATLTAYALDIDPLTNEPRLESEIRYFLGLTLAQRTAFLALPGATQAALAAQNDPALNLYAFAAGRTAAEIDYAAALSSENRALFFSFSPAAQAALVAAPTDTALADFAYATNQSGGNLHSHAAIVFYAGLSDTDRATFDARPLALQEAAATTPAFAPLLLALDATEARAPLYSDGVLSHYLLLAPASRTLYLARPADIQEQLASLAKPALTAAVLDASNFEAPPSDADLRRNLAALLSLSPANQVLFETFAGGPTYSKLESTPGPFDWSDSAWTRTRNSFNSLPGATQTRILGLGAIEGLFDFSGTFIEAALLDYDATLSATARTAIQTAGWGRYFADYFAEDGLRAILAGAAGFTSVELTTLRDFRISPYAFQNRGVSQPSLAASEGPVDARANLAVLAALPPADQALLAKLVPGDGILFASGNSYYDAQNDIYVYPTYADTLANALAFAREFSTSDLDTLLEIDLGHKLISYRGDDTVYVGDSQTTARERFAYILSLYQGLTPEQRDAARDTGVFSALYLGDGRLDATSLGSALDSWNALFIGTRDYLASENNELNLLDLFGSSGAISSLDSLLSGLTSAELATLHELRAGEALIQAMNSESLPSLADLQDFISFISGLGDTQRFTLRELGITREGNARQGLFLSDHEGLARLLQAYADLPGALRAGTRQINPYSSNTDFFGRSFFFASDDGYDSVTVNVGFQSAGDLYVGATRRLALAGVSNNLGYTFNVPAGKDVYLRASTLIDLDSVTFSAGLRAITMEAATINLANLDFPEGSVVSLNSKLGGTGTNNKYPNFGSSVPGRVNFVTGVSYGGAPMFDEPSFDAASRGNIAIGTLQNRAPLPSFTPNQQQQLP